MGLHRVTWAALTRMARALGLAALVGIGGVLMLWTSTGSATAAQTCAAGSSVYVVAHEDDSILFQDPAIQQDIQSGRCVETIFVTAGDAGRSSSYWLGREAGAQASYAQMAGVANTWSQVDAGVAGHPMSQWTLTGNPNVSVVFMRLPDGNDTGSGFSATGNQSLQKLWQGTISSITAVDGSSSYTAGTLTGTLTTLLQTASADRVVTQDFTGTYGDGDHSDHHAVAYFTRAAGQADATPHTLTGYMDYPISSFPVNLAVSDAQAKQATWFSYAPLDTLACQTVSDCTSHGYAAWWSRQYATAVLQQPSAASPALASLNPATGPGGTSVSISASGFLPTHALTVTVGGLPATVTSGGTTDAAGASTVIFTMPAISGGPEPVVVSDGTSTLMSTTSFGITPTLAGLSPVSGVVGSTATISGAGFQASRALTVKVGGVNATITAGGTTDANGVASITFTVPIAPAGFEPVVVSDGATSVTAPVGFVVLPSVSGLAPTTGPPETPATISASGFIASHLLTVTVGGVNAPVTSGGTTGSNGAATVHFTVPSVAVGSQPVVVSDGTNSAASTPALNVTTPPPAVVGGLTPTTGPVGTAATITRRGLRPHTR
jgi:LmbE family N-acetylglucosaminyl deacetylase